MRFGPVELINPPRRECAGLEAKTGVQCTTVATGFCGSDWELMQMGLRGQLAAKFPAGRRRLINGHEGVLYVPSQDRYAVLLIRGGEAADPSRFEGGESYFEYGCDQADGLMSREGFFHPDMLLEIPRGHLPPGARLSRKLAWRLTFADPLACMLFQRERCEDLLAGHNWRLHASAAGREAAMDTAVRDGLSRVVIYGLGTTGLLGVVAICEKYPQARVVAVGRSPAGSAKHEFLARRYPLLRYVQADADAARTASLILKAFDGRRPKVFIAASGAEVEAEIAFKHDLLDNNGIYASFTVGTTVRYDTMPFGFKNHLIFGAINFRRQHMEEAIAILPALESTCLCARCRSPTWRPTPPRSTRTSTVHRAVRSRPSACGMRVASNDPRRAPAFLALRPARAHLDVRGDGGLAPGFFARGACASRRRRAWTARLRCRRGSR